MQPSGRAIQHSHVFMSVYLWQVLNMSTCQDSPCYFWLPWNNTVSSFLSSALRAYFWLYEWIPVVTVVIKLRRFTSATSATQRKAGKAMQILLITLPINRILKEYFDILGETLTLFSLTHTRPTEVKYLKPSISQIELMKPAGWEVKDLKETQSSPADCVHMCGSWGHHYLDDWV